MLLVKVIRWSFVASGPAGFRYDFIGFEPVFVH